MAYEVSWYIPEHILYMRYYGDLTTEEFEQSLIESRALFNSLPTDTARCHTITDTLDLNKMPRSLTAFKNALVKPHPAAGWVCLVAENSLQNMIASTVTQLMQLNFKVFPSRQQALQFLIDRDASLADYIAADDLLSNS